MVKQRKEILQTEIEDARQRLDHSLETLNDYYVKNTIQSIKESEQSTEGENKISIKTGESTIERFFEPDSDDSTSYFFQNAIEDALEEFGDTLELNQKVSVLVKALEELLSK